MKCKERVPFGGNSVRFRGCAREAVRDGYCAQHHPEAVAERARKRMALWEARRKAAAIQNAGIPRKTVREALQRAEAALLRGQCENALVAVLEARRAIEG